MHPPIRQINFSTNISMPYGMYVWMYNMYVHVPDPGSERFKFLFTMRDSPTDYINVTCWGSELYITALVDSFKICDVGKHTDHWLKNLIWGKIWIRY